MREPFSGILLAEILRSANGLVSAGLSPWHRDLAVMRLRR